MVRKLNSRRNPGLRLPYEEWDDELSGKKYPLPWVKITLGGVLVVAVAAWFFWGR